MMQYEAYNLKVIDTADELWHVLSPLNPIKPAPSKFIYRGQGNAIWKLQPAVCRSETEKLDLRLFGQKVTSADYQVYAELAILRRFVEKCDLFGLKLPNDSIKFRELHLDPSHADKFYIDPSKWPDEKLIELMALARHHGLPTCLLDWSRRSYVAAYFAASDALSRRHGGEIIDKLAVWALNIEFINLYPNVEIKNVPGYISINLAAQEGVFTILRLGGTRESPFENKCLEDEFATLPNTPLWKFTLPATQARRVLELCELFGISAASLFPGYDGAAKAVRDHINMWDAD